MFARRLLTMLAHQHGGLLNVTSLAGSLGVAAPKLRRWLDVLEQTFLVRRLTPYHRNVGKRLVKASKLYLRDTGLVHHLLGIGTLDELAAHPKAGRGDAPAARTLRDALTDIGAERGWIVDRAAGTEPLNPQVHRRGFADDLGWLPG